MAGQAANQVIYLEQYIESTYFVPTELSRILNTIKVLDERCAELSVTLQENTAQLCAMPPAWQAAPGSEYAEVMQRVATDQKMLAQFSEEKVQLAQQAYDMLEMHAMDLERTMEHFESDLRIQGLGGDLGLGLGAAGLDMAELYAAQPNSMGDGMMSRGRTPRLEEWNVPSAYDAINSLPLPAVPGQAPPPPAPIATIPSPAAAVPGPSCSGPKKSGGTTTGGATNPPSRTTSQKRLREDSTAGGGTPQPSGHLGAQSAPGTAPAGLTPSTAHPSSGGASGGATGPGHKKRGQGGQSAAGGEAGGGGGAGSGGTSGFVRPPPPNLQPNSNRIQVPGRILGPADIGPGLLGRHAELYWPADSSWYLIEIQDVDPVSKKARIVYTSGEVEELNLDEIAKDRHMSLIPPEYYGAQEAT